MRSAYLSSGTAFFDMTMKWIAPRLTTAYGSLERLEMAAHALGHIPNTTDKIDKARDKDWQTNLKIALSRETLRHLDSHSLERAAGVTVNNSVCSACVCTATYVCSNCRPCL
jgi:hypothetical protein